MATKMKSLPVSPVQQAPTALPTTTRTPELQAKFASARAAMKASLIERDQEIDIVLTALICQENPLLVGPPGTGKSFLLDSLMDLMGGGGRFTILVNKFTMPDEVFGPISLQGLKDGKYTRITTGKLPEADVAFVDEIFKASSAILNTMLRILNERVYEDGAGSLVKVPLKICVAASNEWPGDDGKELGALFDRFLFRRKVACIKAKANRKRLLWKRDHRPKFTETISPAELVTAFDEAKRLSWNPAAQHGFETILDELAKEGITPGDRRQYKSVNAVRAYAYLCGADQVEPRHLEILAHTLWEDPTEQPEKCSRIVRRLVDPVGFAINGEMVGVEDVMASADRTSVNAVTEAVRKLQASKQKVEMLGAHEMRDVALNQIADCLSELYTLIVGRAQ